jgi:hypothetical protein
MKKTISGVLLALTAVFALVACGKKDSKKENGTINFYCWNDEFKTRLNKLYDQVDKAEGAKTTLKNGTVIKWVQTPNQSAVYQGALDIALDSDYVDMFCFEADYATKYVKSNYVADMAELGIDQSKQYQYTKDIVTNASGKLVGSSWQATPGIVLYNMNVAKAVWGDSVTTAQVEDKLSTKAKFDAAAADALSAEKTMLIGPDDWYRTYGNNLVEGKMWDGTNITIDKALFQWAKDTMDYATAGYIAGLSSDFALWGSDWGKEQGLDNTLTIFSCPWFTDFCLTGYRYKEAEKGKAVKEMSDSNLRAAAGYSSWFWGGTWLTATKSGVANESIKNDIKDIIAKMTTDKTVLLELAKTYGDFTNDKDAMTELAGSDAGKLNYFGGQNVYSFYAAAVEKADLSKASDFDQQISEKFQEKFHDYFRNESGEDHVSAQDAWDAFVGALADATSIDKKNIKMSSKVTLDGDTIKIS